jgi:isopenicillin N synthase-like dioxygenase
MIYESANLLKSFALNARDVCAPILSNLDTHLNLPAGRLLQRHKIDEASKTTVRLLHSPPMQSVYGNGRDLKRPARLLLRHTDNGTLAVLFNVQGGLQILPHSSHPTTIKSGVTSDL